MEIPKSGWVPEYAPYQVWPSRSRPMIARHRIDCILDPRDLKEIALEIQRCTGLNPAGSDDEFFYFV